MRLTEILKNYDKKYSKVISLYNGQFGQTSFYLLRFVMKTLEWTGHGIPWLAYAVLSLFKYGKHETDFYVILLFGLILDLLVIGLMKLSFKRSRPNYNEGDLPLSASRIDGYSFPSGHATRAVMLLVLYIKLNVQSQLHLYMMIVWVIMLCLSRIILGRHYITDVVVGIFVGFLEGIYTCYFPYNVFFEFIANFPSEYL